MSLLLVSALARPPRQASPELVRFSLWPLFGPQHTPSTSHLYPLLYVSPVAIIHWVFPVPWNVLFSPCLRFPPPHPPRNPPLHSHQILTILYVLRDPPFFLFDYNALHIKRAQLLDVKWLKMAACQPMLMKLPSRPCQAACTFWQEPPGTLYQSLNTQVIVWKGGPVKEGWALTQGRGFGRRTL